MRKKRSECITDVGWSPHRTYYRYEIIRIGTNSNTILQCGYKGDDTVASKARAAAESSGYKWYWVPKNSNKEENLTWVVTRNHTVGKNSSADIGHLECRYYGEDTFIDRFYVVGTNSHTTKINYLCHFSSFLLVPDSKPMSESVSCDSPTYSPSWFRNNTNSKEYLKIDCDESKLNSSECYYENQQKKTTLQLPLNYDDEDDLRTSEFRCGMRIGSLLIDDCWIIMITIEHRQGKGTTQNLNNETPSSYLF